MVTNATYHVSIETATACKDLKWATNCMRRMNDRVLLASDMEVMSRADLEECQVTLSRLRAEMEVAWAMVNNLQKTLNYCDYVMKDDE